MPLRAVNAFGVALTAALGSFMRETAPRLWRKASMRLRPTLLWGRLPVILRAVVVGALATSAGTIPWAVLVSMNIRLTPSLPWSVPVTAVYLWVLFRYLRGEWWPSSTSEVRRRNCRANSVQEGLFGGAIVAGILGLTALVLFQRVIVRLVHLPAQSVEQLRAVPPLSLTAFVIMGAIVAGVIEEAGFRGYMQSPVERRHGPVVAMFVTGVFFGLAHYSNLATTLSLMPYYMSVAVVYGLLAYFTNSIWPSVTLHTLGNVAGAAQLLATGRAEWQASSRPPALIWEAGADPSFWISLVMFLLAGLSAVAAYRWLAIFSREAVGRTTLALERT